VLVGDRDRELAARALRRHFVGGRLTVAELDDRVDTTLRARSRRELNAALDDLPFGWSDATAGVLGAARRARRRARFFVTLLRMWIKVNAALIVAFAVAIAVGAPIGASLGATAIAWMLSCWAFWRVWRRE